MLRGDGLYSCLMTFRNLPHKVYFALYIAQLNHPCRVLKRGCPGRKCFAMCKNMAAKFKLSKT